DLEAPERAAEALPLAQDRQPREPALKGLQREPLEDLVVRGDRPAPFLVVIADVFGRRQRPPAATAAVVAGREPARPCRAHQTAAARRSETQEPSNPR